MGRMRKQKELNERKKRREKKTRSEDRHLPADSSGELEDKTSRGNCLRKRHVRVCNKTHIAEWLLDSLSTGEETAVDSVNDWLRRNPLAAKETTIQALNGVLAALNAVKLQVNVALRVWIYRNVNNMAIFFFALLANVVLQFLDPGFALLSATLSVIATVNTRGRGEVYLLGRVKHITEHDASARHVDINGQWFRLGLGSKDLLLFICRRFGFICTCKFPHQCVPTIVVEVHTRNICVVEGTGTASLLVFPAAGTVKIVRASSLNASSAVAGE